MSAIIDDTYAEAFKSMYSEVLITAVNRKWLDHAVMQQQVMLLAVFCATVKLG